MKKIIIFLMCMIILIVGIIIYIVMNAQKEVPLDISSSGEHNLSDELAEMTYVEEIEINDRSRDLNRIIEVKYPNIRSFKNKNFQNYINENIIKVIRAYVDEVNTVVDEETPDTNLYVYKTFYEKYACGDYLSMVIDNDYQTGGIRSNKWKDIYNVDVRNERLLPLSDIFLPGSDYESAILNEIKSQSKQNGYVLMNGEGLNVLNKNQKFFIKDNKLIIYFAPAEIAPATDGELQFEMPFTMHDGKFEI